jgi:hypothetical protein
MSQSDLAYQQKNLCQLRCEVEKKQVDLKEAERLYSENLSYAKRYPSEGIVITVKRRHLNVAQSKLAVQMALLDVEQAEFNLNHVMKAIDKEKQATENLLKEQKAKEQEKVKERMERDQEDTRLLSNLLTYISTATA